MERKDAQRSSGSEYPSNKDQQAVDKAPGEEVGKNEQVTNEDLKGKKVDRDFTTGEEEEVKQSS